MKLNTGWQKGAITGAIIGAVIGLIFAKSSGMILTVNTPQTRAFIYVMAVSIAVFAFVGGVIGDTASKINGGVFKQNPFKMVAPWGIGILFAIFAGTFQMCFEACGPGGLELFMSRLRATPLSILGFFGVGFLIGWAIPNMIKKVSK
jgi:hypothetical protein